MSTYKDMEEHDVFGKQKIEKKLWLEHKDDGEKQQMVRTGR